MRACASQSIESVYGTEDVLGTYVPIVYIIGIYVLYVSLSLQPGTPARIAQTRPRFAVERE